MKRLLTSSLLAATTVAGLACTADLGTDDVGLTGRDADLSQALAADADVTVRAKTGSYQTIVLAGDTALTVYQAMAAAGGFAPDQRNGLDYLYGNAIACVTNQVAAACHLYPDVAHTDEDGFIATFYGPRFDSLAGEFFGVLARAQGTNPRDVTRITLDRFQCVKNSTHAGCGIEEVDDGIPAEPEATEPEATEPEATEPEATEPEATEPEATEPEPTEPDTVTPTVDLTGLDPIGPDFVYEGWLIANGNAVTAGRFDVDGDSVSIEVDADLAAASSMYVLTIEPAQNDDPAPSDTHVVAGAFQNGVADLDVGHPAALGNSFANASGGYILGAPSTSSAALQVNGVWFVNPANGQPSLNLPTLPAGWVYEGWVVTEDGPMTTGRFVDVGDFDFDGVGPTAGPLAGPPFPGQDFINPPVSLVGATVVISIEPEPDTGAGPFAFKPLVAMDAPNVDHVLFPMGLNLQSLATGVAFFE